MQPQTPRGHLDSRPTISICLLPSFCLFEQLALPGDVAPITLGQYILADGPYESPVDHHWVPMAAWMGTSNCRLGISSFNLAVIIIPYE